MHLLKMCWNIFLQSKRRATNVRGILGEGYLAYFRKKRMEKAAELLETTNLKVIEIANTVGYENQGKFARVFAETYGVTPLEFRRLSK